MAASASLFQLMQTMPMDLPTINAILESSKHVTPGLLALTLTVQFNPSNIAATWSVCDAILQTRYSPQFAASIQPVVGKWLATSLLSGSQEVHDCLSTVIQNWQARGFFPTDVCTQWHALFNHSRKRKVSMISVEHEMEPKRCKNSYLSSLIQVISPTSPQSPDTAKDLVKSIAQDPSFQQQLKFSGIADLVRSISSNPDVRQKLFHSRTSHPPHVHSNDALFHCKTRHSQEQSRERYSSTSAVW